MRDRGSARPDQSRSGCEGAARRVRTCAGEPPRFRTGAAATSQSRTPCPAALSAKPFPRREGGLWGSDLGWGTDGRQVPIVTGENPARSGVPAPYSAATGGPGAQQTVHAPVTLSTPRQLIGREQPGARGEGARRARPGRGEGPAPPGRLRRTGAFLSLRLLLFIQQIILNNCL